MKIEEYPTFYKPEEIEKILTDLRLHGRDDLYTARAVVALRIFKRVLEENSKEAEMGIFSE